MRKYKFIFNTLFLLASAINGHYFPHETYAVLLGLVVIVMAEGWLVD